MSPTPAKKAKASPSKRKAPAARAKKAKPKVAAKRKTPAKRRVVSRSADVPAVRKPAMAAVQRMVADDPKLGSSPANTAHPTVIATVRGYSSIVLSLIVLAMVGGVVVTAVKAATFQGPTGEPPTGNIPVTIWNATASGAKQQDSTIDIDGSLTLGDTALDLGSADGGENIIYAGGPLASMHPEDGLILLETESGGVWSPKFMVASTGDTLIAGQARIDGGLNTLRADLGSDSLVLDPFGNVLYANMDATSAGSLLLLQKESADRFRVDGDGNVTAAGKVSAAGCFGASFIGITTTGGPGSDGAYPVASLGSYYAANNKCAIDYPGAHVCTVNEMLESIRCSVPTDPVRTHGGVNAWLNGGPPGYTADANDCFGWTSSAGSSYGRFWSFNNTTGGYGTMTGCNGLAGLPISCCR